MLFNMYRYIILRFFLLMIRLPPRSTRTDTLFPYTTLFRSVHASGPDLDWMEQQIRGSTPKRLLDIGCGGGHVAYRMAPHAAERSEEHTSELQSLMRISYAVFCLKKKKQQTNARINLTTLS